MRGGTPLAGQRFGSAPCSDLRSARSLAWYAWEQNREHDQHREWTGERMDLHPRG